MYSWAIWRVSYLDNWVSGPSPGRTFRSLSNPWFKRSIRRLSLALAASLRFFITDSGKSVGSLFLILPPWWETDCLYFNFNLVLSSGSHFSCLIFPIYPEFLLLKSTGLLVSKSTFEEEDVAIANVASGFLTMWLVDGNVLKALLKVVGAMLILSWWTFWLDLILLHFSVFEFSVSIL